MTPNPATHDTTRARLDEIRERLARVRADRWSHEFADTGESIIVTRAVFDHDGKRTGDEAPVTMCRFGPDVTWWEAEFVREARGDLGFLLEQLTGAGRMIRDLRKQVDGSKTPTGRKGDRPSEPVRGPAGAPSAREANKPAKNLAAEASMKCAEPGFQKWLKDFHATDDDGDLTDTAAAAAVLRRVLGIGSRKDLNTDPDAAARWRDLRAGYSAWVQA